MRLDRLFVSGTGVALPRRSSVEEAVAEGLCDPRAARRMRMRSVCVSDGESGPELAVRAACQALRRAGARPGDIDLVLHADTYHQGHDLWAPASYVQRESVGNACPALEVRQLSNGGMAALELAASHLLADSARRGALVTTGDRFCLPGFDRWNTDPGTVCGDGGTALVLSARGGFARLLSLCTVSDPGLEAMGRGDDPFSDAPLEARVPIGVEKHRAVLTRELGMGELLERLLGGQRAALDGALAEAGVTKEAVDWFVLPHLGRPRMEFQFFQPLGIAPERSTWSWGSGVGHLGAGDAFAGLHHLAVEGQLRPGGLCALVSSGAGFAWTVAVLEISGRPSTGEDEGVS
ncbi:MULTISPECIES: ketoacyl-ACP synthase III family protein [unclassified Streptomyces]|uniref:ketoacyl-ACP synthase III family protein n=1 Tax=unclassified Streptomyces TaxID=2593676 RepID=UPI00364E0A22